jgi:hypothetical protein
LLNNEQLESLLHAPGASNQLRLLFCLAFGDLKPRQVGEIRQIGIAAGWPKARTVNVSKYLGRQKGLAIRKPSGWQLTEAGATFVGTQANLPKKAVATALTGALRQHLPKIVNDDIRAFVEEAIAGAENRLFRSAVVLSWVGAVAVLYDYVVAHKLADFNTEATRRNAKRKAASNADDLARMKESEFLDVLSAISVFGKSVKKQLEGCLDLRNGCGHPNSLKLGEAKVAAHIETLMQNVFEKF